MPFVQVGTSGSTVIAEAFKWGTAVADQYVANFASHTILNNTVFGDLADVGWVIGGNPTAPGAASENSTGDLDSASDAGQQFIRFPATSDYLGSPKIIGGWALLSALERKNGARPTLVRCILRGRAESTTDAADVSGFGIGANASSSLATGGAGSQYMITVGATNFEVWNGAAAASTGVAKDTAVHEWEIEITIAAATYRVLCDGVEVVAATALAQDFWPMSIKVFLGASGGPINLFGAEVIYA